MEGLRRDLLEWYDEHRRSLPWRGGGAYAVFVSEVMLQQTRVETVLRHFPAWMERFPDWQALAAASEEEVMTQWAGLGYYRRARNLHAAARLVAARGLPEADGLRALPGVGPYMAGAVASIALGKAVPAVDGNVVRVLARMGHITAPVDRRAGRRLVEELAAGLVDPRRPGDWNQALMDLGSSVCTPRSPRCGACPISEACQARAKHAVEDVPVAAPRRRPRQEQHHFALIEQDGRVLVVARPQDGLLGGTWMLPGGSVDTSLQDLVRAQTGLHVELGAVGEAGHVFTHRLWKMQVHCALVAGGEATGCWVDPVSPGLALSTAARKAIEVGRKAALAGAAEGAAAGAAVARRRCSRQSPEGRPSKLLR